MKPTVTNAITLVSIIGLLLAASVGFGMIVTFVGMNLNGWFG